jgi:hypothetical protein
MIKTVSQDHLLQDRLGKIDLLPTGIQMIFLPSVELILELGQHVLDPLTACHVDLVPLSA